MRKIIKKIGSSIGLYFDKEEQRVYDISEGDIIELEFSKIGHAEPENTEKGENANVI
jgi:hypothetical protein